MAGKEILNLVFSFLGGGLVVALLGWFKDYLSERKARKISILQDQLQKLYGPLEFFSSQNESFFNLNEKILRAYLDEFGGKNWAHDEETQRILKENRTTTIDVANAYVRLVTTNNDKILEILRNNYAHIDPDDIDIFAQFIVDYNRLKTETAYDGGPQIPPEIYNRMGSISFMRPEFMHRIKKKFNAKKKELESLVS